MTKLIVRLVAVAVAAAASALVASPANAAPATPEAEADYAAALIWWQEQGVLKAPTPPQCATVTIEMQPTDPDGEGAVASGTQPRPGQVAVACKIELYEDKWATESTCMREVTLRHELGHNLGLDHSEDPASIMFKAPSPEVWCGEHPPPAASDVSAAPVGTTPAPFSEADFYRWAAEKTRREWFAWRKQCARLSHQVRKHGHRRPGAECWRWARELRKEYRRLAAQL